ncbi:MAG: helix-turn-helix domain-containing protein [Pseudomonadota bacterium]
MTDHSEIPAQTDWYSADSTTFGDRLAGAREAVGLSQAGLAQRLGVKTKTIQSWENDTSEPRANKLQMLSGVLNVTMNWLLTGVGEGLDGPSNLTDAPNDVTEVLTEIRTLRAEITSAGEKLGRLEKRLRRSLEHSA